MGGKHGELKPTLIENQENVEVNGVNAKRVLSCGYDGANINAISVDSAGATDVSITNTTIEQTDGNTHNNLVIAVGGKDGSGNVQAIATDTDGNTQVDVLTLPNVTNAGTFAVQDSQTITDDNAFTPATSKVFMAGFEADETSTDSVDEGDAGACRMTLDRKLIVTTQPHTAGGWSKVKYTAQTTTVQTVKSGAGTWGGYFIYNPNTSVAYLQVFDNSGTITLGTTTPDMVYGIPAGQGANVEISNGVGMTNAIKLACTTTATGSTAPTTGLDMTIYYK